MKSLILEIYDETVELLDTKSIRDDPFFCVKGKFYDRYMPIRTVRWIIEDKIKHEFL